MKILFLSYWGIREGLTRATIIPHIKILSKFDNIKKIILITIERDALYQSEKVTEKTEHIPIHSKSYPIPLMDKFIDFIRFPQIISQITIKQGIDKIIARGSPAGALAYLVYKKTKIPFYVESFEPHAQYMLESGVWSKWDPRYIYQLKWEAKIKNKASGLITVSTNYRKKLITQGINNIPINVAPCAVNLDTFSLNKSKRLEIRNKHHIKGKTITGIYVGKFGGIYFDIEAFSLFKTIYEFFKQNFFLIILSPEPEIDIKKKLNQVNFPSRNVKYGSVDHEEVPQYLSASDFGIAAIKPSVGRQYCSPIKIGEYWANGLPILLTKGVGDESDFLESEKGGVLFDINNPEPALEKLEKLLSDPEYRRRIPELAIKYRTFDRINRAYENLILSNTIRNY